MKNIFIMWRSMFKNGKFPLTLKPLVVMVREEEV